jgi:hypothetical protein
MNRIWVASAICTAIACGGGEPPSAQRQERSTAASLSQCKGRGNAGKACDDGNQCTFNDRCTSVGTCAGTPYSCDDGNQCTSDACDGKGGCTHTPLTGFNCDDGNACTFGDACRSGVCVGTAYSCDDGIACTVDACDGMGGCTHTPTTSLCDDGIPCTVDSCDVNGGCTHTPMASLCDDGNPCTADSCDPSGGCIHTPLTGVSCDDTDPCTSGDVCNAGVCAGTPYSCDDGDPTTIDYCLGDGTCDHQVDACYPYYDCFANECGSGTICNGACCVSSCSDGYQDSDESDVDCGGGCPQCENGKMCWGDWDCQSNHCVYSGGFEGVCEP